MFSGPGLPIVSPCADSQPFLSFIATQYDSIIPFSFFSSYRTPLQLNIQGQIAFQFLFYFFHRFRFVLRLLINCFVIAKLLRILCCHFLTLHFFPLLSKLRFSFFYVRNFILWGEDQDDYRTTLDCQYAYYVSLLLHSS